MPHHAEKGTPDLIIKPRTEPASERRWSRVGSLRPGVSSLTTLLLLLCISGSFAQRVPVTKAKTLNGKAVVVPEIFRNEPAVIVIAFSRKATDDSRVWCKQLFAADKAEGADGTYGLIMLARAPSFLHGLVTRSIRSDIPRYVHSHFLTVPENEEAWRHAAQVTSLDDAYIIVVGGDGTIRLRDHGAYSDAKFKVIRDAFHRAREEQFSADASSPLNSALSTELRKTGVR